MKRVLIVTLALAGLATGCRKPAVDPQPPTRSSGTPTAKGTPIGTAVSTTIGPSGGTITSADSAITVTVPPGAMTETTGFSIQPITNTAPNGIGTSYLLLPEGKQFDKPVSIQFKYTDDQVEGTSPEELLIAYQDTAGIWNAAGGATLDSVRKTITVTSKHFSRWSEFANIIMFVDRPSIDHNESAYLSVMEVIKKKRFQDDDFTAALHRPGFYEPLDGATPTTYTIPDWQVYKDGNIQSTGPSTARYTAQDSDPSPNPVTVGAHLINFFSPNDGPIHEEILKRKIYVSSTYLEIVLNGNTNIYPNATADFAGGRLSIKSLNQAYNGGLLNPVLSGTGRFIWGNDGGGQDIFIWVGGVPFGDMYTVCQPTAHIETTHGIIDVTKWADKVGNYVEGEFQGQVAYGNADRSCTHVIKTISGRFSAKRVH